MAGCGRISFERRVVDAGADDAGVRLDAGRDAGRDGGRDAGPPRPATVIEELDELGEDRNPTLTADELEIYFSSDRGGDHDIYVARRASIGSEWSTPEPVAELNPVELDRAPELSADGLEIFLTSERPPSRGGDLWRSTRDSLADPWSMPVHRPELSSQLEDCCAVRSPDELTLFMSSNRTPTSGGDFDLLFAVRMAAGDPWGAASGIANVNSSNVDESPFVTADLRTLYLDSGRPGSMGARDFYVATRASAGEPFGMPQRFDALSTADDERELWVSPDGARAYFSSDRNGDWQIFVADLF